jgi:hypothetical protein
MRQKINTQSKSKYKILLFRWVEIHKIREAGIVIKRSTSVLSLSVRIERERCHKHG